jgi:hypothetical protein
MNDDRLVRSALRASVPFNLGGACFFAFPDTLGRFAGFPGNVPPVYSTLLALFVLLFGGMYAWLARQPRIDPAFVAFAAIGKTGAFGVVFAFWLLGTLPLLSVVAISGDLVFALIFAWWLVNERRS